MSRVTQVIWKRASVQKIPHALLCSSPLFSVNPVNWTSHTIHLNSVNTHVTCLLPHSLSLINSASLFISLDMCFIYISNGIPFPCYPSKSPSYPTSLPLLTKPYLHFPDLAFPYTVGSSLHRTNGLSSHWWLKRPASATYEAGGMGPSMCTLWLVVLYLSVLGVLVGSYYCSSYGAAKFFNSLEPYSSSSAGDSMFSVLVACEPWVFWSTF